MELILEFLSWLFDLLFKTRVRSIASVAIGVFVFLFGKMLGHQPATHPVAPKEPPSFVQPSPINIVIETKQFDLERIIQLYEECRSKDRNQKQTICGERIDNDEKMTKSSTKGLSIGELKDEFHRESLFAMYRADIIVNSRIFYWEYNKIKNYLSQIDEFVNKYKNNIDELSRAYGTEKKQNVEWALKIIPLYEDDIRPGLEAKLKRMQ